MLLLKMLYPPHCDNVKQVNVVLVPRYEVFPILEQDKLFQKTFHLQYPRETYIYIYISYPTIIEKGWLINGS